MVYKVEDRERERERERERGEEKGFSKIPMSLHSGWHLKLTNQDSNAKVLHCYSMSVLEILG